MHTRFQLILLAMTLSFASPEAKVLSLNDAYNLALKNNASLQEARYTWLANQHDQSIARSFLLPQVNSTNAYHRNKTVYEGNDDVSKTTRFYDQTELSISLSQELFNMSSYYQYSRASQKTMQDLLIYQRALQDIALTVAKQYFDLILEIDNHQFLLTEEKETLQRLKDVENQLKLGALTKSQLLEVKAQAQRVRADIIESLQAVHNRKDQLADSIGNGNFDKVLGLSDRAKTLHLHIPKQQHWIEDAENHNLTLKIAKNNITQAQYLQQAAWSKNIPTITFDTSFTQYDYSSQSIETEGSASAQSWLKRRGYDSYEGSVTLKVPILDGGRRYYDNRKATENIAVAQAASKNTHQQIIRQLKKLYRALRLGTKLIATKRAALNSSTEMSRIADVSLSAGSITVLESLANTANVRKDQQNLARAQYDYIYSLIEMLILSGIITPKDIRDINQDLGQEINIPSLID
jgi:outer membrane protein TolC